MPGKITEADGEHQKWYEQAREQTLATLPEFLRHLTADYEHDYGTIVHAVAAGAIAAAWAVNDAPCGGITGFQAGAVFWEFYANWMSERGPARLLKYDDMLYPQYAHKFAETITASTWKYLREKAAELLREHSSEAHGAVVEHWRQIAAGVPPFGYVVSDE